MYNKLILYTKGRYCDMKVLIKEPRVSDILLD